MTQTVTFGGRPAPSWPQVRDLLDGRGFPVQTRMIDGELAFPDESPSDAWRELRVGTAHGMVTLRREAEGVAVVTWGNADGPLLQAWNALAWALTEAGDGRVVGPSGTFGREEFRRTADLPPALRGPETKDR